MNRSFKTFFAAGQLERYQYGSLTYRYRGILCQKSPIDIAIYLALINEVRPRTIIEIGSKLGGSALMFRDFMSAAGLAPHVVSIDLTMPDLAVEGVRFIAGDVRDLARAFERHALGELPRPWLVSEDSAHAADACRAALDFFAGRLQPGEWLVMEDGVLDELGLSGQFDGGPNRAIREFFARHPGIYEVGEKYCDMFGFNATYNPNGYLKRTAAPFPT